jgi:hypothetical protein
VNSMVGEEEVSDWLLFPVAVRVARLVQFGGGKSHSNFLVWRHSC